MFLLSISFTVPRVSSSSLGLLSWDSLDCSVSFRFRLYASASFSASAKVVAVEFGIELEQAPRSISLLCESNNSSSCAFFSPAWILLLILSTKLRNRSLCSSFSVTTFSFLLLLPLFLLLFTKILKVKFPFFLDVVFHERNQQKVRYSVIKIVTLSSQLSGRKLSMSPKNLIG